MGMWFWILLAIEVIGALITSIIITYYDPNMTEQDPGPMFALSVFWWAIGPILGLISFYDFIIKKGKKRIALQNERIRIDLESQAEIEKILREEEAEKYRQKA